MSDNNLVLPAGQSHIIDCLFYIKGSRDYPIGQSVSKPYGYDNTSGSGESQTAIYTSSLNDVYNAKSELVEIFNNYSLRNGDPFNGISAEIDNDSITDNYISSRNNGENDYISTLLIDKSKINDGVGDIFINNISPNYKFENFTSSENWRDYFNGTIQTALQTDVAIDSSAHTYKAYPRFNIFWHEILRLLERIKYHEEEIVAHNNEPNYIISTLDSNLALTDESRRWFDQTNSEKITSILRNKTILYQLLYLLYPPYKSNDALQIYAPYKSDFIVNPFRLSYEIPSDSSIFGTADGGRLHLTDTIKNGSVINNNTHRLEVIEDLIVGGNPNGDFTGTDISRQYSLDMRANLDANSSNVSITIDDKSRRIKKVSFTISYNLSTNSSLSDVSDQWIFNVYFDPTEFIKSESDGSAALPVWTYNDLNIDNEMRVRQATEYYRDQAAHFPEQNIDPIAEGNKFAYPLTNPDFNIYDNDYANILLPVISDQEQGIKGSFVLSKSNSGSKIDELQTQIIDQIIKESRNGYSYYTPMSVTRISPKIEGSNIIWDTANSFTQEFYIFHRTKAEPSEEQKLISIQNYLKNLHRNCRPTTYDSDGNIVTIGHDGHNDADTTNFLANMYPNIFKRSELIVVPAYYDHCINIPGQDLGYDSTQYFSTTTPKRMIESISKTAMKVSDFVLDPSGNVSIVPEGNTCNYPVEAFYIGSLTPQMPNGSPSFQYPMPWYAISPSSTNLSPLTSMTGFSTYCPEFFTSESLSSLSNGQIFQIIMLVLTRQMFKQIGHDHGTSTPKELITNILGYPISYDCDDTFDNGNNGSGFKSVKQVNPNNVSDVVYFYNKASFIIGGTYITVYAQLGKDFGSSKSNVTEVNIQNILDPTAASEE